MNSRLRYLLLFSAFSGVCSAQSHVNLEIYCMTSSGSRPIEIEVRQYNDRHVPVSAAFVKYRHAKKWIPLVLSSLNSITVQGGQAQHHAVWLEMVDNRVAGVYEYFSQGGLIRSMSYENYSTKKKYNFLLNSNVEYSADMGCQWQN